MSSAYELDASGLRKFGLVIGSIIAIIFGLVFPWLFGHTFPLWPWLLGGNMILWGLLLPRSLRLIYIGWMKLGHILGEVNSRIILGLVFYAVIFPVGVVMRLIGKDPMRRHFDMNASSYRTNSRSPDNDHLEKPY